MMLLLVMMLGREYRIHLACTLLAGVGAYAVYQRSKKKPKKEPKAKTQRRESFRAPVAPEKIRLQDCRFQMRDTRIIRETDADGITSAFATFKITMTHLNERWEVWHRFSEFYVLQLALEQAGLKAPDLPKRTYKKRLDAVFLESRMKGLRQFVQGVIEDPQLNEHPDVRSFLGLPPVVQATVVQAPPPSEGVLSRETSASPSEATTPAQARTQVPAQVPAQTPASPVTAVLPNGERSVLVPGDERAAPVTYRGDSVENLEFTDLHPGLRAIWSDAGPRNTCKVRGLTYMDDKVKVPAGPAMCRLVHMDIFTVDDGDRHDHVVSMGRAKARIDVFNSLPEPPYVFVLNFQIPGDPPVSIVSYWAVPKDIVERSGGDETVRKWFDLFLRYMNFPSEPDRLRVWGLDPEEVLSPEELAEFERDASNTVQSSDWGNLQRSRPTSYAQPTSPSASDGGSMFSMLAGGKGNAPLVTPPDPLDRGVLPLESFHNKRFKLIPQITGGPWVVKTAVGSTPAILGQKVTQRYYRGLNYIETDVHVGSSVVAAQIVGMCRGAAKHLTCDLHIVLQGESEDELPEKIVGSLTMQAIDLSYAQSLFH